jgi:carboxylesterase
MKLHNPQIDPIFKKGTQKIAVLLLHGFTGTPDSMRYQANYLHELGFTVCAPLLEGHGTTPDDLSRTNWQDWLYSANQALNELSVISYVFSS